MNLIVIRGVVAGGFLVGRVGFRASRLILSEIVAQIDEAATDYLGPMIEPRLVHHPAVVISLTERETFTGGNLLDAQLALHEAIDPRDQLRAHVRRARL